MVDFHWSSFDQTQENISNMNLLKDIKAIWHKTIAGQLRRPTGLLAKLVGNSMNKANALLYHLTFSNLHANDGEAILEIGFGNGRYFAELNQRAKNLTMTGIEYSPEMVKEASRRNRDLCESGALKVMLGSSSQLPFANNSFDKIYGINVIYFWETPSNDLKEIYRVLKPGGFFCIGFRPKENLSKFPFSKHGFTLYSLEELKNLVVENGFHFSRVEDGKELEATMNQENTPFESVCMVCVKP